MRAPLLRGSRCGSLCLRGVRLRILAAEALHATGGINHLLLASKKRVAVGADFHVDVALMGRTGLKTVTARAYHADGVVIRMNSLLRHGDENLSQNANFQFIRDSHSLQSRISTSFLPPACDTEKAAVIPNHSPWKN